MPTSKFSHLLAALAAGNRVQARSSAHRFKLVDIMHALRAAGYSAPASVALARYLKGKSAWATACAYERQVGATVAPAVARATEHLRA